MKKIIYFILLLSLVACSKNPQPEVEVIQVYVKEQAIPGTVEENWEEPIYDHVMIPAQLDPTGTYYRPAHRSLVEIYQGRVQPVEYQDENRGN